MPDLHIEHRFAKRIVLRFDDLSAFPLMWPTQDHPLLLSHRPEVLRSAEALVGDLRGDWRFHPDAASSCMWWLGGGQRLALDCRPGQAAVTWVSADCERLKALLFWRARDPMAEVRERLERFGRRVCASAIVLEHMRLGALAGHPDRWLPEVAGGAR